MKKILAFSIFLIFLAVSCKKSAETSAENITPIRVKTAVVQRKDLQEKIIFNGVTSFQQREQVRSRVTGYISWMPFEIGDPIQKGQAFASLRTKEQDALGQAAKIDSSLAKFAKPIVVTSNTNGVISSLAVNVNDYVAEGDVLASISQPNTLVVKVSVPFEFTNRIQPGDSCRVLLSENRQIKARISRKLHSTDSIGQAQQYLIRLPYAELPENLNVQVEFVISSVTNVLSVPKKAIQTNELLTRFWVMKVQDSLAIRQDVKPGMESDSLVVIESNGLQANDRVIIQGAYQMQDSTRISIEKP
ncbi:MAG: HlyD family efflux transporter periplasmic adaptor subunit [Christiangramia sp.]|uniref:efflux RND transporter periplasmic adaptor subunit n=1 Tax=Christiangramia sp. TaxID=1931228 RepID=UPI0032426AE1